MRPHEALVRQELNLGPGSIDSVIPEVATWLVCLESVLNRFLKHNDLYVKKIKYSRVPK